MLLKNNFNATLAVVFSGFFIGGAGVSVSHAQSSLPSIELNFEALDSLSGTPEFSIVKYKEIKKPVKEVVEKVVAQKTEPAKKVEISEKKIKKSDVSNPMPKKLDLPKVVVEDVYIPEIVTQVQSPTIKRRKPIDNNDFEKKFDPTEISSLDDKPLNKKPDVEIYRSPDLIKNEEIKVLSQNESKAGQEPEKNKKTLFSLIKSKIPFLAKDDEPDSANNLSVTEASGAVERDVKVKKIEKLQEVLPSELEVSDIDQSEETKNDDKVSVGDNEKESSSIFSWLNSEDSNQDVGDDLIDKNAPIPMFSGNIRKKEAANNFSYSGRNENVQVILPNEISDEDSVIVGVEPPMPEMRPITEVVASVVPVKRENVFKDKIVSSDSELKDNAIAEDTKTKIVTEKLMPVVEEVKEDVSVAKKEEEVLIVKELPTDLIVASGDIQEEVDKPASIPASVLKVEKVIDKAEEVVDEIEDKVESVAVPEVIELVKIEEPVVEIKQTKPVEVASIASVDIKKLIDESGVKSEKEALPEGALLAVKFSGNDTNVSYFDKENIKKLVEAVAGHDNLRLKIVSHAKGVEGQASSAR
ncbi:hypothetical protein N9W34_03765, partial [Rickettsiales bacterium]|nr:hypothetical protein [Rickettsiales bacterium]